MRSWGWGRSWLEGVELGRAKVESVEEVVARITGGAGDRGAEWEKKRSELYASEIMRRDMERAGAMMGEGR